MKNSIKIIILTLLLGCNRSEESNIFHVKVVDDYYYYYDNNTNYNDYGVDLDMNNTTDFNVNKQNNYNSTTGELTSSIVFDDQGGKDVEFAAIDDCMSFVGYEEEISDNFNYERSATLANNYAIPCNLNDAGEYIAFRIKMDNKWHYGWIKLNYDLNNNLELNFEEWAYYKKDSKAIWAGQTE